MDDDERRRLLRRAAVFFAVFMGLLALGTAGFKVLGQESFEEAFYRAVGSFTTTSLYPEPTRSSERALSAALTVVGGLFYLLLVGSVVRTLLVRSIQETYHDRQVRKRLADLEGHYVVCGYGNIGRAVAVALRESHKDVVVIDRKPEHVIAAERAGLLALEGQAHDSDVLAEAGVARASGLVAAVGSDAENIYIAIAAKQCNKTIYIVARASTPEAQGNMKRARVFDRVSTPYTGAGRALAVEVIEQATSENGDAS